VRTAPAGLNKRRAGAVQASMHKAILTTAVLAALLVGAEARADGPATGAIAVTVVGARSDAGQICVALYDSADAFPKADRRRKLSCAAITSGRAVVVFAGLAPGDYAVYAFHDEDGDRTLETNWIGMPKEGVGTSRGAKGFMGPPKFDDAKLAVKAGPPAAIRISLKYL
jgi:uncharacterized protein (DUF2141 family)